MKASDVPFAVRKVTFQVLHYGGEIAPKIAFALQLHGKSGCDGLVFLQNGSFKLCFCSRL
jgi:hypothetical protein